MLRMVKGENKFAMVEDTDKTVFCRWTTQGVYQKPMPILLEKGVVGIFVPTI